MPRPTRRHPGFNIWNESPQGRMFVELLHYLLGEDLSWVPLAKTRDGRHVFHIEGCRAWGTLVEVQEQPAGEVFVHEVGFRCDFPQFRGIVQMELVVHGWDPWLYAEATGDRSILEAPVSQRRRITEQKRRETGTARDKLSVQFVPLEVAPGKVAGLPIAAVNAARREHGAREERRWHTFVPARTNNGREHAGWACGAGASGTSTVTPGCWHAVAKATARGSWHGAHRLWRSRLGQSEPRS